MNKPQGGKLRSSLREEHRLVTRARIRRAARVCFERSDVCEVSLEMVAAEAEIGRATLYLYYPNKNALLIDLIAHSLRAADRTYSHLADIPSSDFVHVRAWLAKYLQDVIGHHGMIPLFQSEVALDSQVRKLMAEHRARAIALLGRRFAAFNCDAVEGEARARRRCEAEFMIILVQQFCGVACHPDFALDREVAIDVVAERLHAMLVAAERPTS